MVEKKLSEKESLELWATSCMVIIISIVSWFLQLVSYVSR